MKRTKLAVAAMVLGAGAIATQPTSAKPANKGGHSATHRQDATHGHKGKKGGNSADHRQDAKHGHKGKNGSTTRPS